MRFRLTIKGKASEAKRVAKQRGLILSDVQEVSKGTQTTGTAESSHLDLVRWFAEPAECRKGIGYPIGTLLFYSEKTQ